MRAGFGLVGLLIVIGVIVYIMGKSTLPYTKEVLDKGEKAKEQVNQIAGNARDGSMKFSESLTLEPETKGGKIVAVDVTRVVAGGPADINYGLKENDVILAIGELDVKGNIQSDSDAMGQLQQFGYSRSAPLKIMRDGKEMTLNFHGQAPKTAQQQPAAKGNGKSKDSIQQQIDLHQALPGMP